MQYARLDPDQPEGFAEKQLDVEEKGIIGTMTLLRLRQCLGEGYPVIFGFRYYWKDAPFDRDAESGIWDIGPLPSDKGPDKNHGGHAVLAVGFGGGNQRVLCQNSWGDGTDVNGNEVESAPLFWMGYEWIKDFQATSDFWMIRLVDKAKK